MAYLYRLEKNHDLEMKIVLYEGEIKPYYGRTVDRASFRTKEGKRFICHGKPSHVYRKSMINVWFYEPNAEMAILEFQQFFIRENIEISKRFKANEERIKMLEFINKKVGKTADNIMLS